MAINFMKKTGGSLEEIDVRCPKCRSDEVIVFEDKAGYYDVLECKKCGYKNPKIEEE